MTSSGKTENIAGRQEDNNRPVRRKTSSGHPQTFSGRPDVGLYVHVTQTILRLIEMVLLKFMIRQVSAPDDGTC